MNWPASLLITKLLFYLLLELMGILGACAIAVTIGAVCGIALNPFFGICAGGVAFGSAIGGKKWLTSEYSRIVMPEIMKYDSFEEAVVALQKADSEKK